MALMWIIIQRFIGGNCGILLFLIAAVTQTRQQDNFFFDPSPRDRDVIQGQGTLLRCDVSNRKHIRFYWTLNNRKVQNDSRRYQEDSDLRITRVSREEDKGVFNCIAVNVTTGVSIQSTGAALNMLWLSQSAEVQLKHPKPEDKIKEGVDVTLKCHAEGNPPPNVVWFKNKNRLAQTERLKLSKARLKIVSANAEDNGVYHCRVSNECGENESDKNFLLNIKAEDAAHLQRNSFNDSLLKKQDEVVQMNCLYDNAIKTEWYFGAVLLLNDSRRTLLANGTLVIKKVTSRDEGTYRCVGYSNSGPVQTFTSELSLAYLEDLDGDSFEPKMTANKPRVIPVGQKFNVRCFPPDGVPPPSIRWLDPDGNVLSEPQADKRLQVVGDNLMLKDTAQIQSGKYSCVAENLAGTTSASVWIVVSVAPTLTYPPESIRVDEDKMARFECRMSGSTEKAATTIRWAKEGIPISSSSRQFRVTQTDSGVGALVVRSAQVSDEADYTCIVHTTGHPVLRSKPAHLYITKKLKFRPRPVNRKLELTSKSKIHCTAEGEETPSVHWYKIVPRSSRLPEHVKQADGVLFFDGVQKSDKGVYECVAKSPQGTINASIEVDVVVKPRFRVQPKNTTAHEGYPIMLHCVAIGDPTPTIQWDKNSQVNAFNLKRFKVLGNGSLYISEVFMEDIGKYGCTAGNSGGFQRAEIYLHVASDSLFGPPHKRFADQFNMMKTIIIAVCSAVAYLAVVIGLTVYCSIRLVRAKNLRKSMEHRSPSSADKAMENGDLPNASTGLLEKKSERENSLLKSDSDARSHVSGISSHPSHASVPGSMPGSVQQSHVGSHPTSSSYPGSVMGSIHSRGTKNGYDKFTFPRHDLQTLGMLGKGHFGDVFLAKAHGIKDGEQETLVVVKSLLSRDEHHHYLFRREIDMFSKLNHENVVRLLGICRDMEPHFSITEYCDWGDLKQFLWATRPDNVQRQVKLPALSVAQKVTMCNQVALGMEHLSNHRFVHKDLAARNILLTSSLDLKIGLNSLCRDVYAQEYFPFHQQLIPLRWMAPEAVIEDDLTSKSDIWSFGIYIFEVFSLGDVPYNDKTDQEVLQSYKMASSINLEPGHDCPLELVRLLRRCLAPVAKDRPSFSEVAVTLADIHVDSDV